MFGNAQKSTMLVLLCGMLSFAASQAVAQPPTFTFGDFGSGDGEFIGINGVAVDIAGNIYVTDVGNQRIQVFDRQGGFLFDFGSPGMGAGEFNSVNGIAVNSSLERIYVSEFPTDGSDAPHRIQVFDLAGNYILRFGSKGTGNGEFNSLSQLALDKDGNVYVADALNDRIQVFDKDGNYLFKFGSSGSGNAQFNTVSGVALSSDGNIYASDSLNDRVQVFDKNGNFLFAFGSPGSGDGQLQRPSHLAVFDAVYVADTVNGRVQKFDLDGSFSLVIGAGEFGASQPFGLTQDRGRVIAEDQYRVLVWEFDRDGDGLLDTWETSGLDVDGDSIVDVDLPAFGADPDHKDLFLEFDWVVGQEPTREAIQAVKAAFAAAPIDATGLANPDGLPGINIWIDTGSLDDPAAPEDGFGPGTCGDGIDNGSDGDTDGADEDCRVGDDLGGGNAVPTGVGCLNAAFYTTKGTHFDADRALVFRYGVSGDPVNNFPCGGGRAEIGGNDFIEYNHDGGTIMHEFGHTLNLRHGGDVNHNCKPNYVSVMNYDLQFGIPQVGGGEIIDYAPPRFPGGRGVAPLPTLEENDLTELITLDATDASNRFIFVDGNGDKVQTRLDQNVNWDGDVDPPFEAGPLTVNIDTSDGTTGRPSDCTNGSSNSRLTGHEDWPVIAANFRQFGDAADAAINPDPTPDPDLQELLLIKQAINTTDLELTKQDSDDPAVAGEELVYTLVVENNGPNPASEVKLVDVLPDDVTYVTDSAGCVEAPTGTLTCDLGELEAAEDAEVALTVLIDAALVFEAGGPTTITNQASVENLAGPDPDPANNDDSEATEVRAEADLAIVGFSAIDPPAELIVGDVAVLQLQKTITNLGPSSPMNTRLTVEATAAPGLTVAPSDATLDAPALALGELREVVETFELTCQEASVHAYSFSNEIAPSSAEDTDPDLTNNLATLDLQVECVVPVAINIKPRSFPNSIKPGAGVIPVAVLTTVAGEYSLPLDFDAASIDPLSVRFGSRDVLGLGRGAIEAHHKGHLQRSFELDEVTRDDDLDMVLHFRAAETGIIDGDTEACIEGDWIDAAGDRHSFFGCDSIITR